jgi:hypothetical protein
MLYAFGFEQVGVVAGDLYFVDPNPGEGQEGAERGVRVELRRLDRQPLKGSIYSAQPIGIAEPIWRVDLLESVAGPPGSFDRTHHHPKFTDWEPGGRHFVTELSKAPIDWLEDELADIDGVLERAGVDPDSLPEGDRDGIRRAAPEIVDAVRRLLDGVRSDRLAPPPAEPVATARVGWL